MVLHNSKWDRQAKGKYLKKHGLVVRDGELVNKSEALKDEESKPNEHETELDLGGVEIENAFPAEEANDEEMAQIRKLQQRMQSNASSYIEKLHIQQGSNDMFERAYANAERSSLNQKVGKFSKKYAPVDIDSDSDFEEFMDELGEN